MPFRSYLSTASTLTSVPLMPFRSCLSTASTLASVLLLLFVRSEYTCIHPKHENLKCILLVSLNKTSLTVSLHFRYSVRLESPKGNITLKISFCCPPLWQATKLIRPLHVIEATEPNLATRATVSFIFLVSTLPYFRTTSGILIHSSLNRQFTNHFNIIKEF